MDAGPKSPFRLMLANQKGGVAKTTTAIALARYAADQGLKVLLIDCDPQSSVADILGCLPAIKEKSLYSFVVDNFTLPDCVVQPHPNLDLLASNRRTAITESVLMGRPGKELIFEFLLKPYESSYDMIVIDVAPSINVFQAAAMVYTKRLLIPVAMDMLSLQGAIASIQAAGNFTQWFARDVRPIALLPVMVDRRYVVTATILPLVLELGRNHNIPVLHEIRTDATANKAANMRRFAVDFDSKSKMVQDYNEAFAQLLKVLKESHEQASATASA